MHAHQLNRDDFAAVMLAATILHTHTGAGGHKTHTAIYRSRDVIMIPHAVDAGGTVIEKVQLQEVGAHEMALDALKHGLIDPPEAKPAKVHRAPQNLRYVDPSTFTQHDLNILNRLHIVEADTWTEELLRTRILQTEQPAGHSVVHFGIRDDGVLIVLVQADDLFLVLLPDAAA